MPRSLRPSGTDREINCLKPTAKDNYENAREDLNVRHPGSGLVPSFTSSVLWCWASPFLLCLRPSGYNTICFMVLEKTPPHSEDRWALSTETHFTTTRAVKQGDSPNQRWLPTMCGLLQAQGSCSEGPSPALWSQQWAGSQAHSKRVRSGGNKHDTNEKTMTQRAQESYFI